MLSIFPYYFSTRHRPLIFFSLFLLLFYAYPFIHNHNKVSWGVVKIYPIQNHAYQPTKEAQVTSEYKIHQIFLGLKKAKRIWKHPTKSQYQNDRVSVIFIADIVLSLSLPDCRLASLKWMVSRQSMSLPPSKILRAALVKGGHRKRQLTCKPCKKKKKLHSVTVCVGDDEQFWSQSRIGFSKLWQARSKSY